MKRPSGGNGTNGADGAPMRVGDVRHVETDDGVSVPVIDLTHPAFKDVPSDAELAREVERAVTDIEARNGHTAAEQAEEMRALTAASFLVPRIAAAEGKVLGGMSTYFLKLGPDHLGPYATEVDRRLVASIPCVSARVRMHHVSRLLAELAAAACGGLPAAPLHILDFAGGPCMDAVNALLFMAREDPGLVRGRRVVIHALDPDEAGPRFGCRALAALQAEGGPLAGVQAAIHHGRWDWGKPDLAAATDGLLDAGGGSARIVVACSEGGLFEYGEEPQISASLRDLRHAVPDVRGCVGTVTRADGAAGVINSAGGAALRMRPWEVFVGIAQASGWRVARFQDSPLSRDVLLLPDR